MIRGVGLRAATAINVATMVGAGPFITLPLVVTALHGSVSAAAWIAGALIALCDGLVWAELASRFPRSGGTYVYLREAFGGGAGRLAAFLFVWQFLFATPLIIGSGYIGFAQYATYLVPALANPVASHGLALALGVVTLLALYRAIPDIARTGLVLGAVALVTLVTVALAGLAHPHAPLPETMHATFASSFALPALGAALVITLYDYNGYADVCSLGDEVIAPWRTIPRAVVLSVLLVGGAYLLLNIGVVSALAPHEIASSSTVASLVAERALGTPFAIAVTIAVLVTAFGSTYGLLLAASRIPYAAALDGDFLPAFARLHPRLAFPSISLLAIGLLALPASQFPLDAVIAALTAGLVLVQGVAQIVALTVLRRRVPDAPFRVPLYPLPALVALTGWLVLFASTGGPAIAFGIATLACGAIVFFARARLQRSWPFAAAALLLAFGSGGAQRADAAVSPWGHAVVSQRDGTPTLLVDGKPFFFWGGAFFYERIPATEWRSAMRQMRELGANTLDLYVPWNWHEISDGTFDFDGHTDPRRNLREVLRLGRELGFHFVVRPGPVIRNEWRNGGYPPWLLSQPDYAMPIHDVLEGRYPATATLQNAHSDDAAAEWMRNPTHISYASRWLHRVLAEFRPYANLVLAVQLDDDQGAYIDNQTYPAPNFQRYLRWLDGQVRDVVGTQMPTFINTYEMRVPASVPVWTMGNWYQSDAYSIGEHDRLELEFASALLRTNTHGPFAQSEFQAGWLAGPEDPQPRPADPTNTALALATLLAWGAHGVIDFPLADTLAPFGWESPFANAFYGWDAALRYPPGDGVSPRYAPTRAFGRFVARWGAELASAERLADVAIAWDGRATTPATVGPLRERTEMLLARCRTRGVACELVDLDAPQDPLHPALRTLVTNGAVTLSARGRERLAAFHDRGGRIVNDVPSGTRDGTSFLASDRVVFAIETNWSDVPQRFAPGAFLAREHRVHLAPAIVPPRAARYVVLRNDGTVLDELVSSGANASGKSTGASAPLVAHGLHASDHAEAVVYDTDAFMTNQRCVVLQNDRLRAIFVPEAGARLISLSTPDGRNMTDATGALRDDLRDPIPPSPRDYIARYTHGYPAGTFNRSYQVEVVSSGSVATVRFRYVMPDANPSGIAFEKVVSLAPHASHLIVDERLVPPPAAVTMQRAVVLSSLPGLFVAPGQRGAVALDPFARGTAGDLPAGLSALGTLRGGLAAIVAWSASDVEHATWTPYRTTGTLALTLAPGWQRLVYALDPAPSVEAGRAAVEAEAAWLAANRPDQRP